jgi:hypothetical protein
MFFLGVGCQWYPERNCYPSASRLFYLKLGARVNVLYVVIDNIMLE